ncbi:MAG: septum formation initiator family protein [Alphaproteobacteria bacterium]|nr:septum formation initiator family protein [Alphaproteobacteria bacterium]
MANPSGICIAYVTEVCGGALPWPARPSSISARMTWLSGRTHTTNPIAGYFVYHIVIGARGIVSWAVLSRKVVKLENRLAEIKKENKFLENKVHGMRSESLDLDLLEEQAEKILCFSYPQDTIVLLPNE